MDTVAVTGASGLLGGNVVMALISSGYAVRALRRPSSDIHHLAHLPADWRTVSFESKPELAEALQGATAVIHCAGVTVQSRWLRPDLWIGNVLVTESVIEACLQARVPRMVHCSSTVTCGFSASDKPVSEDHADLSAPPWTDGYFSTKCLSETEALRPRRALDVVVVNPGFLIGPLDPGRSSGRLVRLGASGRVVGWTSGCNNFVDVRDVAAGILGALEHGRAGQRYILGGENLSYRDFLVRVATAAGHRPPMFPIAYMVAAAAGRMGDAFERITARPTEMNSVAVDYSYFKGLRYSSEKARRELGYRTRPIDEAIESATDWIRRA
jgi:dihydroflavonol-4-reductase